MKIGDKPFIVAEMSGNHSGYRSNAFTLIFRARQAGCDAIKIQLYEPDDLCDPENNHIYEKCRIPQEWLPALFEYADAWEIPLFASVFAPWAVEELEKYNCPAYKIASPESTRLPAYEDLVTAIEQTGKLFIASSGANDMPFVQSLNPDIILYCVAGYPAKIDWNDLVFMRECADGFSDHTAGLMAPLAMIQAGAKIIEKHFKLDDNCIDAAFSLNPEQMKTLCDIAHE